MHLLYNNIFCNIFMTLYNSLLQVLPVILVFNLVSRSMPSTPFSLLFHRYDKEILLAFFWSIMLSREG
jgi:hypothetical protein